MSKHDGVVVSAYRWVVLAAAWLIFTAVCYNWNIVAVRPDIMRDLNLTPGQFNMVYTAPTLACIILCLAGGWLGDRFGIRITVGLGALIAVAGCFLRLTATGYYTLFLYSGLIGIGLGVMFPNLPKLVGIWFPPKQAGLATGLYMTGLGVGMTLAFGTGQVFPDWRLSFWILGAIMAAATAIWFVAVRNRPAYGSETPPPAAGFFRGLISVLKIRQVVLLCLLELIVGIAILCYVGSLTWLLPQVKGLAVSDAGLVTAISIIGFILGTFFWPVLSSLLGVRRPLFLATFLLTAAGIELIWFLAPSPAIWYLAFLPGFTVAGPLTYIMMAPLEMEEIGPGSVGVTAGAILSFFNIGAFVGLPFLFTPAVQIIGADGAYVLLGVLCVLAGVFSLWVREPSRPVS